MREGAGGGGAKASKFKKKKCKKTMRESEIIKKNRRCKMISLERMNYLAASVKILIISARKIKLNSSKNKSNTKNK